MECPEEREFLDFLNGQKREGIKKLAFWIFVLAAFTFLIMFGIFSLFDTIAQTITGML